MNILETHNSNNFHALFIREAGFWFLDCSAWDRQEMLVYFHNDPTSLKNKRLVELPDDSEASIKYARRYLTYRNTPSFVDLSKENIR